MILREQHDRISNLISKREKRRDVDHIKNGFNHTLQRSSKFNQTLDVLFSNCDEKQFESEFNNLLQLHPEFETEEQLRSAVSLIEAEKTFDDYEIIQQEIDRFDIMKSPDFIADLHKCLVNKKIIDGESTYQYMPGHFSSNAMDCAGYRYIARIRYCACGNPNAGVEGSLHMVHACYP